MWLRGNLLVYLLVHEGSKVHQGCGPCDYGEVEAALVSSRVVGWTFWLLIHTVWWAEIRLLAGLPRKALFLSTQRGLTREMKCDCWGLLVGK